MGTTDLIGAVRGLVRAQGGEPCDQISRNQGLLWGEDMTILNTAVLRNCGGEGRASIAVGYRLMMPGEGFKYVLEGNQI
jgi:hypothetical protein